MIQQLINAVCIGSSLALFAVGFTLLFGTLGVLNFAHGVVLMYGAFAGVVLTSSWGQPLILAPLAGAVVGGVVSLAVEGLIFRPLRRRDASHFNQLVASIGAATLLTAFASHQTGATLYSFPTNAFLFEAMEVGGVVIPRVQALMVVLAIALMFGLNHLVNKRPFGRMMRAVADDPEMARAHGVRVGLIWSGTFFIAGALAGTTGVFIGMVNHSVDTTLGSHYLLIGFAAVVIGGLGSTKGAVIGGLLVGLIRVVGVTQVSSSFAEAFTFLVLFAFIVWRPNGLFGASVERA